MPFNETKPPINTRGDYLTFDVPAVDPITGESNLMSVEWVEVQLDITGDADAMNYLRITLVSPDGTQSELTQNLYRPSDGSHNFQSFGGAFARPATASRRSTEAAGTQAELNWVYSTNRDWGERSDSAPAFDEYGEFVGYKGWEIHFENYSGSDLHLGSVSVAVHGSPIASPASSVERISGKVGIDSGYFDPTTQQVENSGDGEFNFDRFVDMQSPNSVTPLLYYLGDTPYGVSEIRVADPTQEKFASNVLVYAIDVSTGNRIAQFLTGADGNYYFDLPAGDYMIGIEDPLGRTVLADGRNYDSEWQVTIDPTDPLTRTAGRNAYSRLQWQRDDRSWRI